MGNRAPKNNRFETCEIYKEIPKIKKFPAFLNFDSLSPNPQSFELRVSWAACESSDLELFVKILYSKFKVFFCISLCVFRN